MKGKAPAEGKSKVTKSGAGNFAKGGKGHMFGKGHSGPQVPGQTAQKDKNDGGKFIKGGKTKMFPEGHAKPSRPGATGKPTN